MNSKIRYGLRIGSGTPFFSIVKIILSFIVLWFVFPLCCSVYPCLFFSSFCSLWANKENVTLTCDQVGREFCLCSIREVSEGLLNCVCCSLLCFATLVLLSNSGFVIVVLLVWREKCITCVSSWSVKNYWGVWTLWTRSGGKMKLEKWILQRRLVIYNDELNKYNRILQGERHEVKVILPNEVANDTQKKTIIYRTYSLGSKKMEIVTKLQV